MAKILKMLNFNKTFTKTINFIKTKKIFFVSLIIVALLFSLDILTKRLSFNEVDYIIEKTKGVHTYIKINNFINIVKVINTGVSFGFLNSLVYGQYILSIITFLIVIFVLYLLWKSDKKINSFSYSLIIAGGFGNLYDRIIYGGVFDFLDFHIGEYHWPAFNLADSIICIGVGLLLLEDLIKFFKKR